MSVQDTVPSMVRQVNVRELHEHDVRTAYSVMTSKAMRADNQVRYLPEILQKGKKLPSETTPLLQLKHLMPVS